MHTHARALAHKSTAHITRMHTHTHMRRQHSFTVAHRARKIHGNHSASQRVFVVLHSVDSVTVFERMYLDSMPLYPIPAFGGEGLVLKPL